MPFLGEKQVALLKTKKGKQIKTNNNKNTNNKDRLGPSEIGGPLGHLT